jgi:hypothetical protein
MVLRSAQNHGAINFLSLFEKSIHISRCKIKSKIKKKRILRDTILKETDKQTDRGSYEKYSDHETLF